MASKCHPAANAIANGSLTEMAMGALGGGGGGGGPAAASVAGTGNWGVTVGGDVSETIGAIAAISAMNTVSFSVGGDVTESIGAARIELAMGGKEESTGGAKTETTSVYMVTVGQGIAIDAEADIDWNVAGNQKQSIGKTHGISADGAGAIDASKLTLKGSGKVTLKCGAAEIIIDSGGIGIMGKKVTVEGSQIKLSQPAIGTP